jgi:hypothetical protein
MRYYGSEPAPRTCDPLKIQTYAHIDNNVSDLADVFPDKFTTLVVMKSMTDAPMVIKVLALISISVTCQLIKYWRGS